MSKLSLILSIGIALAAVISPIFVAIINNLHSSKIRKIELEHDEEMKRIEASKRTFEKHYETEFLSKSKAFSNLMECASQYYADMSNPDKLASLYASAFTAVSLCSIQECRNKITNFIESANNMFYSNEIDVHSKENFIFDMSVLSNSLTKELLFTDSSESVNNK